MILLALLYVAAGSLGLHLDAVSGFATLVWPCTGLALAALVRFGLRLWPGVLAGALVLNLWTGASPAVALGIALGNTLEAIIGAMILRRAIGGSGALGGLRQVLGLLVAAIVPTLVSASIGVAALGAGGVVQSMHQAIATAQAWWVGDVLGALVVAPLLLAWSRRPERSERRGRRRVEASGLALGLGLACLLVFSRAPAPSYVVQSEYLLFPLFAWAALRFELRGASLATAAVSAIAVYATYCGTGPFVRLELSTGLLALQAFMGCAAITTLVVAGVTMDRARAVRAQDTFVATLSHDLKNPLYALSLSGESLQLAQPSAPVDKHVRVLKRSVERMLRLVTDLLDVAAIERGKLRVEPRPENLRALVDEAAELLRPLAAAKGVALAVDVGGPVDVACDRERILQVLSNVLGNAVKFSPANTTVRVAIGRREQDVVVAVRDHGPGIPHRDLRRVFDRHWHAEASAGGGSGLGLFIAKGIVDAHGGTIWADSELGEGTTFHIALPAARREMLTARMRRLVRPSHS